MKQENEIYQLCGTLPGHYETLELTHWGHAEDYSGDSTNAYRVSIPSGGTPPSKVSDTRTCEVPRQFLPYTLASDYTAADDTALFSVSTNILRDSDFLVGQLLSFLFTESPQPPRIDDRT